VDYDVVFIRVESDGLVKIHEWIKHNCIVELTHPEYTPHMTLAYVKSGTGKVLAGSIAGKGRVENCLVNSMEWSAKSGNKIKMIMEGQVTFDEAMETGLRLGIDFDVIDFNEFWKGLEVELEHGNVNPETDIIPDVKGEDDLDVVGLISLSHLSELPDYYTRLARMEKEAGV
jgi:hypothetical protein